MCVQNQTVTGIKSYTENLELSEVASLKPGVGQNVALCVLPTTRIYISDLSSG